MNTPPDFLESSLDLLTKIALSAYNDRIAPVAMELWRKHLSPENPQWEYLTVKAFCVDDTASSAHVMAILDSRLPWLGIVGYFACTNDEAGAQVLNDATNWLKEAHAIKDVYGPINGTLPNDYRLNMKDNYCFPGEPVNPSVSIDAFKLAGFNVFNRYESGKTKHFHALMKMTIRKPVKAYTHLVVRQFNIAQEAEDFKTYHELRNAIFPSQSIYCPAISLEERIYNSSGKFDPNFTYFLMDNQQEVGFAMGYEYKNQLIVKTIGILPEYRGMRVSGLLLKAVHDKAAERGLDAAIYGMIRVGNRIYKMKRPGVKIFRHYVTMHKSI